MIIRHLERLIKKGWWTVGSQPAIDGAKSEDEVVGWGPKSGYVYQKSFVEFFVEKEDVERIENAVRERGQGWVDYFAANLEVSEISCINKWIAHYPITLQGGFRTNVHEGGRNAVTWGIFPGQEVAQTTIIEKESFLAWKVRIARQSQSRCNLQPSSQEEAFSMWSEWASYYAPESAERKLLDNIRTRRWLISIVHHNFKEQDALWKFLFNGDKPLV
jgi:methylenetetrahydrofolate reductase (NADPH)